jgi:hypothetical protein
MVYPPATSEAGARRPAIIQLEQFKESSSKPAQLKAFIQSLNNSGIIPELAILKLFQNFYSRNSNSF